MLGHTEVNVTWQQKESKVKIRFRGTGWNRAECSGMHKMHLRGLDLQPMQDSF
jgi:hypothetical protein